MEIAALGLRVDGVRDIDQASASLDRLAKSGGEAEKGVSGVGSASARTNINFTALARSAAGVAASLGLVVSVSSAFRAMVSTASSFEDSMARVRAITRATDADMLKLSKTARELGASTVFSAAEAADGLQFLGMAGFNTEQAIAAIPGVLDLAASSAMGLAQTADIATNVMSGFGLAAGEAGRVADILAAASSRANTDVAQLGDAMSTVAPIAAAMRIPIEDTAAAIGVLSDAGIQGSRAGTSLRGVFAALAGPTTQAQKILARVGLTAQDINPELSDLETVLRRLSSAGLSTADMMQIFGREAASGAIVLAETAGRVGELGDELRGAEGEARRMADTMQDTLTGDAKELSSAMEELLLTLNDKTGLQAMLRGSTQRSTELVSGFNSLLNESELLNETLRIVSSTAGALIDAVKLMVGGVVDAVREFGEMVGVIQLAESALPGLTRAVRFFADGIQDASIWLRFFGNVVKRAFSGDVRAIQKSWEELQEAFRERVAERETRRLNEAVEDLLKNTDLFGTFEGAVTEAVGRLADDAGNAAIEVDELDDELQKLIKSLQTVVDRYDKSGAQARRLAEDHRMLQQALELDLPGAADAMERYWDAMRPGAGHQAFLDGIDAEIAAAQRAADVRVESIGLGDRMRRIYEEQAAISQEFARRRTELTENQLSEERRLEEHHYKAAMEALVNAEQARLNIVAETGERILAEQESWVNGARRGLENYVDSVRDVASSIEGAITNAFTGMEDALTNFVKTGKLSFRDLANSIIDDMIRIMIQQSITGPLASMFGGWAGMAAGAVTAQAKGGAWDSGVQKFAQGGAFTNSVVSSPTMFPLGLMGEAGPEAIMPLSRGPDGKLGVRADAGRSGGGDVIITVNVNDMGAETNVNGRGESAAIGKNLAQAIQATVRNELTRAQRQGGQLWRNGGTR